MNVYRSGRWLRVHTAIVRVDEVASVHVSSLDNTIVQVHLIARGSALTTESFKCDGHEQAESLVFEIFSGLKDES
jgi:hypothetical protein